MIMDFLENVIVDDMTPKQVRYITPVTSRNATGQTREIYKQIRRDFQLVPPLTLFSPSPTLLAGVWSIWRESQFALGKVDRAVTEAVSAAISGLNACPYCVDAHSGMLHALAKNKVVTALRRNNNDLIRNDMLRRIVEWAQATRNPGAEILSSPPFNREAAPEIIGTAIVYHFINRMANIFLTPSPLPVPNNWHRTRKIALRIFGATVAKRIVKRKPEPGQSLKFIQPSTLPPDLAWAERNDHIATAFAAFSTVIEKSGQAVLTDSGRALVQHSIQSWQGEDMGLSTAWVKDIVAQMAEADKAAGELALLTALAPHHVSENTIRRFRSLHASDRALLELTAWAGFTAARRTGEWLNQPVPGNTPRLSPESWSRPCR